MMDISISPIAIIHKFEEGRFKDPQYCNFEHQLKSLMGEIWAIESTKFNRKIYI